MRDPPSIQDLEMDTEIVFEDNYVGIGYRGTGKGYTYRGLTEYIEGDEDRFDLAIDLWYEWSSDNDRIDDGKQHFINCLLVYYYVAEGQKIGLKRLMDSLAFQYLDATSVWASSIYDLAFDIPDSREFRSYFENATGKLEVAKLLWDELQREHL